MHPRGHVSKPVSKGHDYIDVDRGVVIGPTVHEPDSAIVELVLGLLGVSPGNEYIDSHEAKGRARELVLAGQPGARW